MVFQFGVSVIDVHGPDHPSLRGPGCMTQTTRALFAGFLIGCTIGGVYAATKGIKYGLPQRELLKVVSKQMISIGLPVGLLMYGGAHVIC